MQQIENNRSHFFASYMPKQNIDYSFSVTKFAEHFWSAEMFLLLLLLLKFILVMFKTVVVRITASAMEVKVITVNVEKAINCKIQLAV